MADETFVIDVSDVFERAVKTAIEAGLASFPFVVVTDVSKPALVAAGIAAASAGLAVILNTVKQYAEHRSTKVQL